MTSPYPCMSVTSCAFSATVPTDDTYSKLTDHSTTCETFAEETCALNAHETRTIVSCAKHHLPVPCSTCLENEKVIKKAVDEKKKEVRPSRLRPRKMELRPSKLGSYLLGIAPEGGLLGGMYDCGWWG